MRGVLLALVLACALPGSALAGTLTLDPAGGGAQSYAAWKAQEGIPDSQGSASQALYFQAQGAETSTAVVRGLEGLRVGLLTGLSWEHRTDGACDANNPRWTLFLRTGGKALKPVRFGCAVSLHSPGSAPGWIRDSNPQPVIRARILATIGSIGLRASVDGLEIDFGPKASRPDVFLDNVTVNDQVWTSAADNGNGSPPGASALTDDELLWAQDPFADSELMSADDLLALGLDTSEADSP